MTERITFEVTTDIKEKLKIRSAKYKNIKEYMNILLDKDLNNTSVDLYELKNKIETQKNNLENKMRTEINIENFSELFHLNGQLDLLKVIMEVNKNDRD